MNRDWDVIREVLIEVEALDTHTRDKKQYEVRRGQPSEADTKAEQAQVATATTSVPSPAPARGFL